MADPELAERLRCWAEERTACGQLGFAEDLARAGDRIKALEEALESAVGLLWEHCEGLAPRIESLEAALKS